MSTNFKALEPVKRGFSMTQAFVDCCKVNFAYSNFYAIRYKFFANDNIIYALFLKMTFSETR